MSTRTGKKLGRLGVEIYKAWDRQKHKEKVTKKPLIEELFGKTIYMAWEMRKK